jgi:hypothetical protein
MQGCWHTIIEIILWKAGRALKSKTKSFYFNLRGIYPQRLKGGKYHED